MKLIAVESCEHRAEPRVIAASDLGAPMVQPPPSNPLVPSPALSTSEPQPDFRTSPHQNDRRCSSTDFESVGRWFESSGARVG